MLLSHWKQGRLLHILRFELQGEEQAAPEISSPSDAKDETSVPHLVGSAAATFGSEADIFSVSLETDNSLAALLDLTKVHQRWNCSGSCVQPSSSSEGVAAFNAEPVPIVLLHNEPRAFVATEGVAAGSGRARAAQDRQQV